MFCELLLLRLLFWLQCIHYVHIKMKTVQWFFAFRCTLIMYTVFLCLHCIPVGHSIKIHILKMASFFQLTNNTHHLQQFVPLRNVYRHRITIFYFNSYRRNSADELFSIRWSWRWLTLFITFANLEDPTNIKTHFDAS